jgi:hypothetical protein
MPHAIFFNKEVMEKFSLSMDNKMKEWKQSLLNTLSGFRITGKTVWGRK